MNSPMPIRRPPAAIAYAAGTVGDRFGACHDTRLQRAGALSCGHKLGRESKYNAGQMLNSNTVPEWILPIHIYIFTLFENSKRFKRIIIDMHDVAYGD